MRILRFPICRLTILLPLIQACDMPSVQTHIAEACGAEYVLEGMVVPTDDPIRITEFGFGASPFEPGILALQSDLDVSDYLGDLSPPELLELDFENEQVVVFTTTASSTEILEPCINAVVDLDDGRRAVNLGSRRMHGVAGLPAFVSGTRALILPRTEQVLVLTETGIDQSHTELAEWPSACQRLEGKTFQSADLQFGGECLPDSPCQIFWFVSFSEGTYEYHREDTVSRGEYSCDGGMLSSTNYSGTYMQSSGELIWDNITFIEGDNPLDP